ncbi:MAG: hypothetical protein JWN89_29 [Parcubacteria group bacterium]|nr:hypothetical protein [Parcubacteria group bacterium]
MCTSHLAKSMVILKIESGLAISPLQGRLMKTPKFLTYQSRIYLGLMIAIAAAVQIFSLMLVGVDNKALPPITLHSLHLAGLLISCGVFLFLTWAAVYFLFVAVHPIDLMNATDDAEKDVVARKIRGGDTAIVTYHFRELPLRAKVLEVMCWVMATLFGFMGLALATGVVGFALRGPGTGSKWGYIGAMVCGAVLMISMALAGRTKRVHAFEKSRLDLTRDLGI